MIMARLGRESTLLKNGQYIKDLSYMNRDLKDIIYIDFDDEKV
jgi:TFIIF-interacting CTD phosphatase-like protein